MPLRLGPLRVSWRRPEDDDPYWDAFINRPAADILNTMPEVIRRAPEGNVFPVKSELHSPDVMASHVKELTLYLRAQLAGVADLGKQSEELAHGFPYAVVAAVKADYDPYTSPGIGGQVPVQAGQFATFIVASWIRELGYRASIKIEVSREDRERLAIAAGIGTRGDDGRFTVPKYGTKIYIADIIFTDLPMKADG
jgi:hypothetical protein